MSEADPATVLHVDDEEAFLSLTATVLEREGDGLRVESADSVAEGLARIAEGGVDCVVSDYDMPGQTGIEFLSTVRETHPDLPFMLFTGKGSETVASEAISAGVTDYLQKGTGTDQFVILANRIENAVDSIGPSGNSRHTTASCAGTNGWSTPCGRGPVSTMPRVASRSSTSSSRSGTAGRGRRCAASRVSYSR